MGLKFKIIEDTPEMMVIDMSRTYSPLGIAMKTVFCLGGIWFIIAVGRSFDASALPRFVLLAGLGSAMLLSVIFRNAGLKTIRLYPRKIEVADKKTGDVLQGINVEHIIGCTGKRSAGFGGTFIFDMPEGKKETLMAFFGLYDLLKTAFAKRYQFHVEYDGEK